MRKDDYYVRFRIRIPRRDPYLPALDLLDALSSHDRGAWIREAVLEKWQRQNAGAAAQVAVAPTPDVAVAVTESQVSPKPASSTVPVIEKEDSFEEEAVSLDELDHQERARLGSLVAIV